MANGEDGDVGVVARLDQRVLYLDPCDCFRVVAIDECQACRVGVSGEVDDSGPVGVDERLKVGVSQSSVWLEASECSVELVAHQADLDVELATLAVARSDQQMEVTRVGPDE
jgi:hypothetical protein